LPAQNNYIQSLRVLISRCYFFFRKKSNHASTCLTQPRPTAQQPKARPSKNSLLPQRIFFYWFCLLAYSFFKSISFQLIIAY